MIIYAIFLCIAGSCERVETARYSTAFGLIQGTVYTTKASCQRALPPSREPIRYVCLGRRIETWK